MAMRKKDEKDIMMREFSDISRSSVLCLLGIYPYLDGS